MAKGIDRPDRAVELTVVKVLAEEMATTRGVGGCEQKGVIIGDAIAILETPGLRHEGCVERRLGVGREKLDKPPRARPFHVQPLLALDNPVSLIQNLRA
jgi:hypothetical protein